ncbi:hypothetical protein DH2020_002452 [Rehmannia glutinosa]|uniref:Uncharacterized protein n=1 Tax=Rehmannia glutinosa TaxID=99300 RepID=A0ABR0XTY8_REHGL
MASTATLPISNPQFESQPPIAIPTFRNTLSRLNATVRHGLSQRRPWLELIDRYAFSRPDTINYVSLLALSLALSPFFASRVVIPHRRVAISLLIPSFGSAVVVWDDVGSGDFEDSGGVYYKLWCSSPLSDHSAIALLCRPLCGLHAWGIPNARDLFWMIGSKLVFGFCCSGAAFLILFFAAPLLFPHAFDLDPM